MRLDVPARLCAVVAVWAFAVSARAQEMVQFPATDSAIADRVTLRAELVKPAGDGPFPAVILMHGCGGWQPAVHYSLQAHAEYLARHGYAVLDLDSFGPRHASGSAMCASDARLREALGYRPYDAFDAARYLQSQPFIDANNIFLMGQSNGGSVALEAARADALDSYHGTSAFRAVVAYYPWCGVYAGFKAQLGSPLLIFSGGADDWVSAGECGAVRAKGADFAITVYPEAVHSFDVEVYPQVYLGHRIGYDAAAATDSEAKMLAFFNAHLSNGDGARRAATALASVP